MMCETHDLAEQNTSENIHNKEW